MQEFGSEGAIFMDVSIIQKGWDKTQQAAEDVTFLTAEGFPGTSMTLC